MSQAAFDVLGNRTLRDPAETGDTMSKVSFGLTALAGVGAAIKIVRSDKLPRTAKAAILAPTIASTLVSASLARHPYFIEGPASNEAPGSGSGLVSRALDRAIDFLIERANPDFLAALVEVGPES